AGDAAHAAAPPRSGSATAETRPRAERAARASAAARGSPRPRAPATRTDAGTSREHSEGHAEGQVGEHVMVRDPMSPTRGTPRGDLAAHGLAVRPRLLARPDHHAHR